MADAAAIDAKYDAGESITPLCGLPLAVKDAIDVLGSASVPAFDSCFRLLKPDHRGWLCKRHRAMCLRTHMQVITQICNSRRFS